MKLKDDGTIVRTAEEIAEYEAGVERIFAETTANMFPSSLLLVLIGIPVTAWAIAMIIVQFIR